MSMAVFVVDMFWSVVYVSMTVLVVNGVCGIRKNSSVWWLMWSVEYISMLVFSTLSYWCLMWSVVYVIMLVFDVVCCIRKNVGG